MITCGGENANRAKKAEMQWWNKKYSYTKPEASFQIELKLCPHCSLKRSPREFQGVGEMFTYCERCRAKNPQLRKVKA